MSQAERGLFERIAPLMNYHPESPVVQKIETICAEFEQRLSNAESGEMEFAIKQEAKIIDLERQLAEAEKALEMAKFQNDKYKGERYRFDELRHAIQEWHSQSVTNGYDGIGHALNTLFAIQKGPRELTATQQEQKQ